MGKGGPLAFLNKKTWHPASLRNMEEVWKREQNAEREQKKLEELQKQITEEREKDELNRVAEAAGVKTREERLDWMYAGGMAARQDADKRAEEQLLGAKPVELPDEKVVSNCERASLLPSFYAEDTPASANETWARLHNDPLFAIKQQELTARKSIVANPVKMQQIKKEIMELKELAKKSSKDKKHKKQKKEKKEKSKKHKHSSSPDAQHPIHKPEGTHKRHRRGDDDSDEDGRRRQYKISSPRNVHDKQDARDKHDVREKHDTRDKHERKAWHRGDDTHHTHSKKYGLDFLDTMPEEAVNQDRSDLAEATRKRLEEAARKKEQEEREKAAQRHVRSDYRPGKLSAQEKAARLASMMADADTHRHHRTAIMEEAKEREKEDGNANGKDAEKFMKHAAKSVYGAEGAGAGATLEDRVGRRKFYSDRKGDAGFRR